MFICETSIASELKHPRIVESLGLEIINDHPSLVMEFGLTEDLEQLVWRHASKRRVRLAAKVILQLLEELYASGCPL